MEWMDKNNPNDSHSKVRIIGTAKLPFCPDLIVPTLEYVKNKTMR